MGAAGSFGETGALGWNVRAAHTLLPHSKTILEKHFKEWYKERMEAETKKLLFFAKGSNLILSTEIWRQYSSLCTLFARKYSNFQDVKVVEVVWVDVATPKTVKYVSTSNTTHEFGEPFVVVGDVEKSLIKWKDELEWEGRKQKGGGNGKPPNLVHQFRCCLYLIRFDPSDSAPSDSSPSTSPSQNSNPPKILLPQKPIEMHNLINHQQLNLPNIQHRIQSHHKPINLIRSPERMSLNLAHHR